MSIIGELQWFMFGFIGPIPPMGPIGAIGSMIGFWSIGPCSGPGIPDASHIGRKRFGVTGFPGMDV